LEAAAADKMPQKVWHNVRMGHAATAPVPLPRDFAFEVQDIERGVPITAIDRFAVYSEIPLKELLEVVIPPRTLKHRRQRGEPLNMEESDRLARVARLYELAVKVFGNADKARKWLTRPKFRLDERTPLLMMRSELGGRRVEEMLYQIDEGVFA
jgi:putative toxin-antitoxin system antitoxin component (TIGR02293 family)